MKDACSAMLERCRDEAWHGWHEKSHPFSLPGSNAGGMEGGRTKNSNTQIRCRSAAVLHALHLHQICVMNPEQ